MDVQRIFVHVHSISIYDAHSYTYMSEISHLQDWLATCMQVSERLELVQPTLPYIISAL